MLLQTGDLHLQVLATNVVMGSHIAGLEAFGEALSVAPQEVDRGLSSREQLLQALQCEDAMEVVRGLHMPCTCPALHTPPPPCNLCSCMAPWHAATSVPCTWGLAQCSAMQLLLALPPFLLR